MKRTKPKGRAIPTYFPGNCQNLTNHERSFAGTNVWGTVGRVMFVSSTYLLSISKPSWRRANHALIKSAPIRQACGGDDCDWHPVVRAKSTKVLVDETRSGKGICVVRCDERQDRQAAGISMSLLHAPSHRTYMIPRNAAGTEDCPNCLVTTWIPYWM